MTQSIVQIKRASATDQADLYRDPKHKYVAPEIYGLATLLILPQLYGKPWDNLSLDILYSVRPSSIRVTLGEISSNFKLWRVTVYLEQDNRTIREIEQEVQVGVDGASNAVALPKF